MSSLFRSTEEFLSTNEEFQSTNEGSNDGVWDRNIRTGEVYFSRQWKVMLGFAEGEIGSSLDEWSNRIHPDDSRKQVIVSRVVNLNETILYVRSMLRRLISENIDLHFDVFQEDLYVMADSGKIEQVLMNLATNSKDAISRDGTIIIGTSRVSLNGGFVQEHDYIIPGEYARISVSDTGCGMDEETKRKIFEPFLPQRKWARGPGSAFPSFTAL